MYRPTVQALCALLVLVAGLASAACSRVLRVPLEDWAPFAYWQGNKPAGLDVELINAIMEEAGCRVTYLRNFPRARRQMMLKVGDVDLLYAASVTPERQAFSWFTRAYRNEEIVLFATNAPLPDPSNMEGLLEGTGSVMAPYGGWYGQAFASVAPKLYQLGRLSYFDDTRTGVRMLLAGRAEYILGDRVATQYEARVSFHRSLRELPFLANSEAVHLMLSKATVSEAEVAGIDKAIERLEQRGELRRIRAAYGLK